MIDIHLYKISNSLNLPKHPQVVMFLNNIPYAYITEANKRNMMENRMVLFEYGPKISNTPNTNSAIIITGANQPKNGISYAHNKSAKDAESILFARLENKKTIPHIIGGIFEIRILIV